MEIDKFTRDKKLQNDYKIKLKQESIKFYGKEKCWASHKPYKGLIASHIKPYKLCVLENDTYSEFNINNGLLLSKTIDDYFDKLLITFDENGKIICSDKVPDEIKEEFLPYQLDSLIYNDERKNYMRIHRGLFYYKNFYNQGLYTPANIRLSDLHIPYFDCGIKYFKGNFIIFRNSFWEICPTNKIKQEFVKRTDYKFKYSISNADFVNVLMKTEEYSININITPYLNTPSSTINVEFPNQLVEENEFKISTTNFEIDKDIPKQFLKLLKEIFKNELEIESFRTIVNIALQGNGHTKGVILYGDLFSIDILTNIIEKVVGSYCTNYFDTKILYKQNTRKEIPNCCMLFFNKHNYTIDSYNWNKIVLNDFFPKTMLNINQYVPFVSIKSSKPINIDNAIFFNFKPLLKDYNIDKIVEVEGSAILNWFINCPDGSEQELSTFEMEAQTTTPDSTINTWLQSNCEYGGNITTMTSATELYDNYFEYTKTNMLITVSSRYFFLRLSRIFQKKRLSFGMVYIGIKIK